MRALTRAVALAAAAIGLAAIVSPAASAAATERDASSNVTRADGVRPDPGREPPPSAGPSVAPAAGSDNQRRPLGSVNPLAIANPFCDQGLEAAERRNCRVTGTPEGRYPTSNYGFDIHVDTGLDNIVGNFQALLAQIANAIWQAVLFVLNLTLTLLGWAFGLSPFTDNATMGELDRGLERFYGAFTEPWLVVGMVAIGAATLWRGIVRREVSPSVAAALLSTVLILVAMWMVHEPRQTIGTLAHYANEAAISVLAAPQRGSLADPAATYGEATADVWSAMTLPGFAALNFSDSEWALSRPDPELLATANRYACLDAAYLAQIPPRRWQQLAAATDDPDCEDLAALVPAPRTNAEIYLRSSPGSLARHKLWDEHTDDAPYSSYFQIQGDAGAWTRLPLVIVIALGLLGGVCLLAWLALRIFIQTAVAFVLVLATPLALFFPAFGESGRRAFVLWGATLLGALVSKLVYAALLSVVLFATIAVGGLADGAGAMMAFLVMAGLWWAVFLKREALVSFISIAREGEGGDGRVGRALGVAAAAQLGRRILSPATGALAGAGAAAAASAVGSRGDRAQATRRVARGELDRRAEGRLEAQAETDRGLVATQGERRERLATLGARRRAAFAGAARQREIAAASSEPETRRKAQRSRSALLSQAARLGDEQTSLRQHIDAERPREARAREVIAAAEDRERRGGARFSARELAASREAIRAELDRPLEDPVHAWRAGMSRERYAALAGTERERVHAAVGGQLRDDRLAFGAIPARPDGLVDSRARRSYRVDVARRPDGRRALHAERLAATRRRRAHRHPSRRGVSR